MCGIAGLSLKVNNPLIFKKDFQKSLIILIIEDLIQMVFIKIRILN